MKTEVVRRLLVNRRLALLGPSMVVLALWVPAALGQDQGANDPAFLLDYEQPLRVVATVSPDVRILNHGRGERPGRALSAFREGRKTSLGRFHMPFQLEARRLR